MWALAAVALLAAGAETWRYVLLLASREGALSADAVAASDALVLAAGTGTVLLGLAAGGFVVGWSLPAAAAAAARSNSLPSRSWREIVLGWVVPGWNLAVAGPVLAEIEHGALDRAPDRRPQPSRLVGLWWLLWVAGGVLTAIALVWSWRTGVQARADGVVLHAVLDLLAAVTAGVTAVLVGRLTVLLNPVRAPRRRLLLAVGDRPRAALNADPRARSGSQPQLPQPPHDEVRPSPGRRREHHPRQATAQRIQHRRHLQPRERRAQAVVHPRAEPEVRVAPPPHVQLGGIVEDLRVVRRGAEQGGDLRARGDVVPGDGRVAQGGALEQLQRRVEADELLDGRGGRAPGRPPAAATARGGAAARARRCR